MEAHIKEELKLSAANFGFDSNWIADLLDKYGPDVLALVIEAARNGFSVAFITEFVDKLGPMILQLIVEWLNRKNSMGVTGEIVTGNVIQGVDSQFIDVIIEKYLPIIIQKYLPMILEKWGPQLVQFILELLMKNLTK